MDEIKLFPHNEEALEKLNKCLESNQMVSINHATGTGKSFIVLKYISQNKDKKILYLSPTYQINNQFLEVHTDELNAKGIIDNVDTMIYSNLLDYDMESLANKYDIIILDEYHRCGAKKWGEKVNKLLDIVKNKHPDTKVIGTTATPVRYLDNNKDMNNILFDGVCASTLTLADAILKGILPPPVYVNSTYQFIEEIERIEKRIKNIIIDPDDLKLLLNQTKITKNQIMDLIKQSAASNTDLEDASKYLVFSSRLESIKSDMKFIDKFLGKTPDHSYEVSYQNDPEKNTKLIEQFRNDPSDEISVLYSVNLLNEGIHVKDVDALFMLRPTQSPIIYFQQLGRLLSYSRRDDQVVVFDLVNNLKNNSVIYNLYNEVMERAKELCETDKENKERYERIIKNFIIVDTSSKVSEKIDQFNNEYSKDNLIELRLSKDVQILQDEGTVNEKSVQAYLDLFKYQDYITLDMFKAIQKLSIDKPSIFDMSYEDYESYLKGSKNIRSLKQKKVKVIESDFIKFINKNAKLPSPYSNNQEEVLLFNKIVSKIDSLSNDTKNLLYSYITPELDLFELISYGVKKDEIDKEEFSKSILKAISNYAYVNHNVISNINKDNDLAEAGLLDLVLENDKIVNSRLQADKFMKSDKDDDMLKEKFNSDPKILLSDEFSKMFIRVTSDYSLSDNEEEYFENFTKALREFIKENERMPSFNFQANEIEKYMFCEMVMLYDKLEKEGYNKEFDSLLEEIRIRKEKAKRQSFSRNFLEFCTSHDGKIPLLESESEEEKALAKEYEEYGTTFTEEEKEKLLKIQEDTMKSRLEFLKRYFEFIKKKNKIPFINSSDDIERELARDYERYYRFFTKDELRMIGDNKKAISMNRNFSEVYREMLNERKGDSRL